MGIGDIGTGDILDFAADVMHHSSPHRHSNSGCPDAAVLTA